MVNLESTGFGVSVSKMKLGFSFNDNEHEENHHVTEETNYLDILGLCDETSVDVPDTEINLRCYESIDDIWDCPKAEKYRQKITNSKIRRLKPFESLSYNNEKEHLRKSKLIGHKRKQYHTSSDISSKKSLRSSQKRTQILNVPPNSPFDARQQDSSFDNPFVTCLLKILEQTRMNNLSNDIEASPLASSQSMSIVPTSFYTSDILMIPDVGSPHCPSQHQPSGQSSDDHVVPQLNEQIEAHSFNMFYDNDIPFSPDQRLMRSCIDNDHIVPDSIEE